MRAPTVNACAYRVVRVGVTVKRFVSKENGRNTKRKGFQAPEEISAESCCKLKYRNEAQVVGN